MKVCFCNLHRISIESDLEKCIFGLWKLVGAYKVVFEYCAWLNKAWKSFEDNMLASWGQNLLYLYATCCNSTFIHNFDAGLCTYESFFKKWWLRPMNDLVISFSLLTLDVRKSQHNCVQRIFTLKVHYITISNQACPIYLIQSRQMPMLLFSPEKCMKKMWVLFLDAHTVAMLLQKKSIREIHKMILSNNKSMSSL